jgi:hypothetical protein
MRNFINCGTKRNELSNSKLRIAAAAHDDASPRGTSPAATMFARSMRQTQARYGAFVERSYRRCVTGAARDLRKAITSLAWTASHVCWQPGLHRVPHASA